MQTNTDSNATGITKVDENERTTGFMDTVGIWSATGINTASWYFGGMAAAVGLSFLFKFSFIWVPLLMIPWAGLAYIGYKHGATTVAVTRPSLGHDGSRLTGIFEFLVLLGWPTINSFIAGISLSYLFKSQLDWPAFGEQGGAFTVALGVAITAIFQGVFILIGHKAIKYLERVSMLLLLVLGIWQSYVILTHWSLSDIMNYKVHEMNESLFYYLDLAIAFSWTWAQVCDFSRYSKNTRSATIGTWLGINIGQGWFMLIGGIGVIGVAMQTGVYSPDNSDPSSIMAELGLGMIAFLILAFATVSTNVTNLYGAALGLTGAMPNKQPKKLFWGVAILQFVLCFIPLAFGSFIDYFTLFLSIAGGMFIPLWTVVLTNYFISHKGKVTDDMMFTSGVANKLLINKAGMISVITGFIIYTLIYNVYTEVASEISAFIPTILITGAMYLILSRFETLRGNNYALSEAK